MTNNNKYNSTFTREFKILDQLYQSKKINFRNLNLNDFSRKFLPFIHLVNYWSQILGFVVYRCSNPNLRNKIIKNLFEENCEEYTHVDTFLLFIKELENRLDNIQYDNIQYEINLIPKNIFIEKLQKDIEEFVLNNTFDDSCQMLGAIEYVYHLISSDINSYCYEKFNIKPRYHYCVHETLDISHATDLFDCNSQEFNIKNLEFGGKWIVNAIQFLLD